MGINGVVCVKVNMLHLKAASENNKRKREVFNEKINKIWLNIAVIAIVGLVVFC